MKKIFSSAIMGVVALILVNISAVFTGISVSINYLSLVISAFLGVSGVITMLLIGFIIGNG